MKSKRAIIAAVLSAMLVTAGFPVAASAAENEVLLGDADGSGAVDVTDATMIQMIAAELATVSAERLKAADVNGDGKVDVV
ncbi:MAG: dockerin type I repeat-containing protein, partial [Eubacteriales bacterium]|nr:dockerin type I repeat-containing protein [Eubacteriales bacterium]